MSAIFIQFLLSGSAAGEFYLQICVSINSRFRVSPGHNQIWIYDDKEQNIEKKKVSVIFWTFGKNFFEIYIKFACW